MCSGLLLLPAAALLVTTARALEVVGGSQCYDTCGGGVTLSTDLVCNDIDYTSTQYGQKMAACLNCESTSLATNDSAVYKGGNSDEYWFMCMSDIIRISVANADSPINSQHEVHSPDMRHRQHIKDRSCSGMLQRVSTTSASARHSLARNRSVREPVRLLFYLVRNLSSTSTKLRCLSAEQGRKCCAWELLVTAPSCDDGYY